MEKDHLSIKKVVKNFFKVNQRWKLCARLPITVSSCPAVAYMCRWTFLTIQPLLVSSFRKNTRVKSKKIRHIRIIVICFEFNVCLSLTFPDNCQNVRTEFCSPKAVIGSNQTETEFLTQKIECTENLFF